MFVVVIVLLSIVVIILSIVVIILSIIVIVFEACYTAMDSPLGRWEIPFTKGLQFRVIAGGIVASTARAIIETPLEYAKVGHCCMLLCWDASVLNYPLPYIILFRGYITECIAIMNV